MSNMSDEEFEAEISAFNRSFRVRRKRLIRRFLLEITLAKVAILRVVINVLDKDVSRPNRR